MQPLQAGIAALVAFLLLPFAAITLIAGGTANPSTMQISCTGPVAVGPEGWQPPLTGGYTVTSAYGNRFHPVERTYRLHAGIDLAPKGDRNVLAAASGRIESAGWMNGYGNQVAIDHGGGTVTRYAHLANTPTVTTGQQITAGTPIGQAGAAGTATGIHLHFEVRANGSPTDPTIWMADRGAPLDGRTTAPADPAPADLPDGAAGGTVNGQGETCGSGSGSGNPDLPPLAVGRIETVLAWARSHIGDSYVFGATGPNAWDCSSFTQAAFRQIGLQLPRTAQAQRDWLAAGNGHRVTPGSERPGDLVFWSSYLGPDRIGHVVIVGDPVARTTIDARSRTRGVGEFEYGPEGKSIYEVWRIGDLTPKA